MARKKKEQLDAETASAEDAPEVSVEEAGVIEDVDTTTKLVKPEPKKPERVPEAPAAPAEPPPVPKRYEVVRGGKIMHRRLPTFLRPGKVIDEREYNIAQVEAQGVALKLVKE